MPTIPKSLTLPSTSQTPITTIPEHTIKSPIKKLPELPINSPSELSSFTFSQLYPRLELQRVQSTTTSSLTDLYSKDEDSDSTASTRIPRRSYNLRSQPRRNSQELQTLTSSSTNSRLVRQQAQSRLDTPSLSPRRYSFSDPPAPLVETASMDMEIVAGPSNSASAATGIREEAGRKRLTEETVSVTPAGSVTESPTSRLSPDKRADVPRPHLKSVVIPRPPYRVGHLGRSAPQMSLADAIEQYGDPDAGSEVSSVPSGTNPMDMSLEIPETVEEAHPPAFLLPSDDVSGSVVTNDSKRIWMAAEHLYPSQ